MVKNRVLVDTSVLIAALLSNRGGSFYVLRYLNDKFVFQINEYILGEVNINLADKFSTQPAIKARFFPLIAASKIMLLPYPSRRHLRAAEEVVNKKDAPILASALAHSDYLLTLDNDFLADRVVEYVKGRDLQILRPEAIIHLYNQKF